MQFSWKNNGLASRGRHASRDTLARVRQDFRPSLDMFLEHLFTLFLVGWPIPTDL